MVTPIPTAASTHAPAPRVLVALAHPTMRRYVCDLIEHRCRCWVATAAPTSELAAVVADLGADAVVTDASGLRVLAAAGSLAPPAPVLVIGPDDEAYRDAALLAGAGAWVARTHAPETLGSELAEMLERCTCGCQPRS